MIKSFSCRDTKKLFNDQRVRRFQSFERQARKRLMVLHAAPGLQALMLNPGNRFHALSGDRKEQYSISINDLVDKVPSRRFYKNEISIYGSDYFYIHYI